MKRYRDGIEADQIRELAGALVQGGLTRGIFVTTSSYQPGAKASAEASASAGIPIELYDSERFYGALKIAQRRAYDPEKLAGEVFRAQRLPLIGRQRVGVRRGLGPDLGTRW